MNLLCVGLLAGALWAFPQVEHVHEYHNCICSCGDVTLRDDDDKTIILTKELLQEFDLYGKDVVIPSVVNLDGYDYTVVGLGGESFQNHQELETISLPDTMTVICAFCFDHCENLKSVNMPDSISIIGISAFQLCSSLEYIDLPENLSLLGNFAYNHCSSAKNTEIVIPGGLTTVGFGDEGISHYFYDAGNDDSFIKFSISGESDSLSVIDDCLYTKDGSVLLSIPRGKKFVNNTYEMPDSVTALGELSFSRNCNIDTVILSDNLCVDDEFTDLQKKAFNNSGNELNLAVYGFSSVANYETKPTNLYYKSVNGILYTKNLEKMVAVPFQYSGDLIIPDGVMIWCEDAIWSDVEYFKNQALNKISKIHIPSSLTVIPDKQLNAINNLVDLYGTVVEIDSENFMFYVSEDGHIARIL